MVHTCELFLDLRTLENSIDVLEKFGFSYDSAFSYLEESFNGVHNNASIITTTAYDYPNSGIHEIRINWYRFREYGDITTRYHLVIRMEPQMMITQRRVIDLFAVNPDNLQRLRNSFHDVMSNIIDDPNSYLTDINSYSCRRIDYAINLDFSNGYDTFDRNIRATDETGNAATNGFFDNNNHLYRTAFSEDLNDAAEIFFCFTGATSTYCRRRKRTMWRESSQPYIDFEHIPDREQSTAEGNKSCKIHFYCKAAEVRNIYRDNDPQAYAQAIADSKNIIRFELQCYPNKVRGLKNTWQLEDRSLMNYLQPQFIRDLLIKNYRQTIGLEDFYSFYHAQKIINSSNRRAATKTKLINTLRLIAQARHVSKAKEQFIRGTRIKHTDIIVGGGEKDTAETFNRYLRNIRELGINPFIIPKDWHITRYRNPVYKIHEAFEGIC